MNWNFKIRDEPEIKMSVTLNEPMAGHEAGTTLTIQNSRHQPIDRPATEETLKRFKALLKNAKESGNPLAEAIYKHEIKKLKIRIKRSKEVK
jgi:hypothetical protein